MLALAPLPFAVRWIDGRDDAFPAHIPANVRPIPTRDPTAEIAAARVGAFVLVMTHDHAARLSPSRPRPSRRADLPFVGLIGSATKRARFERRFREIGIAGSAHRARSPARSACRASRGKEPAVIAASVGGAALGGARSVSPCRAARPTAVRTRSPTSLA